MKIQLSARTLLPVALLAASFMINISLFRIALRYYRLMVRTSLDPLGLSTYHQDTLNLDQSQRIVVFGDSRALSWPKPSTFSSVEFINRGISGQTTTQVLGRFPHDVGNLEPDIVIIQAGINDLKAIPLFPDRKTSIVNNCKQNLHELVRSSLDAGAVAVVTTIIPPGDPPIQRLPFWSTEVDRALQECNRSVLNQQKERVIVLDTSAAVSGANGRVHQRYQKDFLHLNPAGYEALNHELTKALLNNQLIRDGD